MVSGLGTLIYRVKICGTVDSSRWRVGLSPPKKGRPSKITRPIRVMYILYIYIHFTFNLYMYILYIYIYLYIYCTCILYIFYCNFMSLFSDSWMNDACARPFHILNFRSKKKDKKKKKASLGLTCSFKGQFGVPLAVYPWYRVSHRGRLVGVHPCLSP